ncbi:MAG: DNA mismatch repair protein MutS [Bacteroidota bacterium]|jgi:DNA mismatch repair protein MutS|nr:DNA mismatch repair protein MutS [Terrimonas sp.]
MAKRASNETPLMQQHRAIKQKYPDAILLFRVGDFYETFGQDAVLASQILGITLTKRNNGAAADAALAGFPHHSLDTYLHKLVKAGHRVAVCDQLEDPKQAKGIVKRGVTEMLSPGTTTNDKILDQRSNNFLLALHTGPEDKLGLAFLDISTGELYVTEGDRDFADKLIQGLPTAELVVQRQHQHRLKEQLGLKTYTYTLDEWIFDETYTRDLLLKHFQVQSLKGFGVEELPLGCIAAGAIFHYLKETDHPHLQHISRIQRIDRQSFLWMDRFTIRNLELLTPSREGNPTLLSMLDHTQTPMGGRRLKRWMIFPLVEQSAIQERLDTVEFLIKESTHRYEIRSQLEGCGDLERLAARLSLRKTGPREIRALAGYLRKLEKIKEELNQTQQSFLLNIASQLASQENTIQDIERTLVNEPPAVIQKGEAIAAGVHPELDQLRSLATSGKQFLQAMQEREIRETGITSLKIGFNSVFGYYLEVTHAHKEKVPSNWIRKQTLTNAERYITPELKEYEEKIMGAEERIRTLEFSIFEELLTRLQLIVPTLQKNADAVANLDCLCCFANNALQFNYCKPEVTTDAQLLIEAGRHPVIERCLPAGEPYIGNDLLLDPNSQQLLILTGPNMSGKSALLRQTALICLLAHMGHYVPAKRALIPLTDKIFTRVGASDNLAGGESTFMVEMNETASIINNLSERSLVILDEIGRGTSTYDGVSIAWSIAAYLHESPAKPKTLFATHYHELNELEEQFSRVRNFHITYQESGNRVIFLRKLAPGGSLHSFGLHVARMAGMPTPLLDQAAKKLAELEGGHKAPQLTPQKHGNKANIPQLQLSIFGSEDSALLEIKKELENVDIEHLTPLDALLKLQALKRKLG